MNIRKEELQYLKKIKVYGYNNSGGIYKLDNYTLLKIFYDSNYFIIQREENTNFLLNDKPIKNSSYPIEKAMINGQYSGYTMPYFKNCNTFRRGIFDKGLSHRQKIKIIEDVLIAFIEYHQRNIIFGDIHLDNYIYNANNGYLIDIDDIKIPNLEHNFSKLYDLRYNEESEYITSVNKCTDNIKSILCLSSLIFNFDLETIAIYGSIQEVEDLIIDSIDDKILKKFYKKIFNQISGNPIYMTEVLEIFKDEEKINNIKKNINSNFRI